MSSQVPEAGHCSGQPSTTGFELRYIGPADIEFYEPLLVRQTALAGLPPGQDWEALSYRAKQRRLDAAVKTLAVLLNHPGCVKRFLASVASRTLEAAPPTHGPRPMSAPE